MRRGGKKGIEENSFIFLIALMKFKTSYKPSMMILHFLVYFILYGLAVILKTIKAQQQLLEILRTILYVGIGQVFYLCSNNSTSFVLFSFFYNEFRSLSFLSSNLLGFNCSCEFPPKCQTCDWHIIQCNIELRGPCSQYLPYFSTNSL